MTTVPDRMQNDADTLPSPLSIDSEPDNPADSYHVAVRSLTKELGGRRVLDEISLELLPGQLTVLLGPSGCGKTTLLRIVAGLDRPDSGTVEIEGTVMSGGRTFVPPMRRRVGMVFQDLALWPHLSVDGHLDFALAGLKLGREEQSRRRLRALELFRLVGLERRLPSQLSGGECQRLALARSVVHAPRVWLLDEPLSSLDAHLRRSLRDEIARTQRTLGLTSLFVTHDQEEGLGLAQRVIVMREGRIEQVGTPEEVYESPATLWLAGFLGNTNLLEAMAESPGRVRCVVGSLEIGDGALAAGDAVTIGIRPEDLEVRPPADAPVVGRIIGERFAGSRRLWEVTVQDVSVWVETAYDQPISVGDAVGLRPRGRARLYGTDGQALSRPDAVSAR